MSVPPNDHAYGHCEDWLTAAESALANGENAEDIAVKTSLAQAWALVAIAEAIHDLRQEPLQTRQEGPA
jgi:hypothetical protein